ncbi:MAG: head GIN domain-containing protein [Sphingomonas sp.]
MRRLIILAALPLAACSAALGDAGVAASGSGGVRDFPVSDFTRVSLTGSDDVRVRTGAQFSVHAEGPSETLDLLRIERDGDTLKIGRKPTIGFAWGGRGATITVTMPAIRGASVTGSGDLTVDHATGDAFDGAATGSGNLSIAALAVKNGSFSVTGSGDVEARGTAQALTLSVTGSGDLRLKGVEAQGATVSVMGSGNAAANVNGAATVSVMGSGDVDLGPKARCTTSKLGSGEVSCGH